MSVYLRFVALFTVPVLALACDDSPTAPGVAPIAFENVWKSSVSGFSAPRREVVRDADEWARTWDLTHGALNPVPPLPEIDFNRDMVALAAMGTGHNGCFRVDVQAIHMRGNLLEVEVTEFEPGPTCSCTQAVTQPVHLVRLERMEAPASFLVRRRQLSC